MEDMINRCGIAGWGGLTFCHRLRMLPATVDCCVHTCTQWKRLLLSGLHFLGSTTTWSVTIK